nr:MAG TPA: Major tail protein [Bacteriophage sp.]
MLVSGYRMTPAPRFYFAKKEVYMKFPHLDNATAFPGADVHVYDQYVNTYDYNMWTPKTKIKLCHVKWRDDGHDAVKFRDDAERDAWFDALDGETVHLDTSMYIARADTDGIKIPVPYMTAQRCNYIVVDFTTDILQSPLQQPDCQTRYHYYITDITAEAPNTTTVVLQRDMWTDYINTTTINGLLLARGHAPLVGMTPAKLLDNPRENSVDMLAPDVNYGGANNRITNTKSTSLTGGDKYICFACAFGAIRLEEMARTRGADIAATEPVYGANDGTVSSWTWGTAGIDVSGCRTLGTSYASQRGRTPNNWTVFALRASDITGEYINDLFAYYPHITSGIGACFVVSADMCVRGTSAPVMVNGVAWMTIIDTERTLSDITLTPEDFDMPPEVADVAKLYVSPYSVLEITDTWGKTTTINIEDCGRLSVRTLVSVAYPLVRQVAYLDGYGADGSTTIAVSNLTGATISGHLPNADALTTLISYDIPTYALQRRNIDAYRGANYNRTIRQNRENAITAYENTAQAANTARDNANTSAATARGNTARTNAAQTANTARGVLRDQKISDETVDARNDILDAATKRLDADTATANSKIRTDRDWDVTLMNETYVTNTQTNAISSVTSMIGSIGGAALPVASGGAATGLATAISGAALQGYNTGIAITNSEKLNKAANDAAYAKADKATSANTDQTAHAKTQATETTIRTNTQTVKTMQLATAAATDMTANTVNASNGNASASYDTATGNAARTRNQTLTNAKRSMLTTRDNATNTYRDMYNQPPAPVGAYSGDPWPDEMAQRAYIIKVRTQTKSALIQAGMYMLRYGIASNKLYNRPDLTPCRHYTYWRADDVWLTNGIAPNDALDAIRDRFAAGVTIWNDPTEIGGDYLAANIN